MITERTYKHWQQLLEHNWPFRWFWIFWSNYSFIFFIVVAYLIHLGDFRNEIVILSLISFVLARVVLVSLINLIYKRPRPYQAYGLKPITSKFFSWHTNAHNSFPSRHTISYASIGTVLCFFYPVIGAGLLAVTVVAGVGRMILGYHYVSDIFGGLYLGILVGIITTILGSALLFT